MKLNIAKPSITSYLHYAHDLLIAETDERAREYLAVSFLQLLTTPDSVEKSIMLDFCTRTEGYPQCPFLSNELLTDRELSSLGKNAVEKARSLLDTGHYVRVNLNEFYVSQSVSYQIKSANLSLRPKRLRPLHFNLLYGYDLSRRTFLTHGFDKEMRFGKREIFFDEFELAYYGDDVGMHRLRLLSNKECNASLYSRDKVIQCLTDFLESNCSYLAPKPATKWVTVCDILRPYVNASGLELFGASFGMEVYDVAARMVERKNGKLIDIRPWCVIHDHKRSILRLCDYLIADQGLGIDSALINEFKLIEKDFLSLRNYLLEAKLLDRKVKSSSLKNNLRRLKDAERVAVGELIVTIATR